jgi:hypothetical protein
MKIKVFYSWQSDIGFNNQAIRDALKLAIVELERIPENPRIDSLDSTSNLVGASRIPDNILHDISKCDIFLCDLTVVGKSAHGTRALPNPNVLIELGYALSELSWHRTIVVFNEHFGDLKQDLPFDIEKRSVLTARIAGPEDSNGKGTLKSKLKDWIQKIIIENPLRVSKVSSASDSFKRANDVRYLKQFLKIFDILEMDYFFQKGHTTFDRSFNRCWQQFLELTRSNTFFMYDQEAKGLLIGFASTHKIYQDLLGDFKNGTTYYTHKDIKGHSDKRFNKAKVLIREIEVAYTAVLNYIRTNYIEIKFKKPTF